MSRKTTILALLALPLLTACAGKLGGPPPQPAMSPSYSASVGFTGVGTSFAGGPPVAATATSGAVVPTTKVRARSSNLTSKAEMAIRSGGSRESTATLITVAEQDLWFSLVDVGDTRFAVLKKPRGVFVQSMRPGTNRAFAARVPELTGCSAANSGYGYGASRTRPLSIAIPLTCS